jgi:hypothetical protein
MPAYRATVDYGDDRIRTYLVTADSIEEASTKATEYAVDMLSVDVLDDVEEWDEDDFDQEIDFTEGA